jgi:hypothetical protein
MSWIKLQSRSFLYVIYLISVVAFTIEVVFRILPVSDSLYTQPISNVDPIYHFKKNRRVTKQIGFDFTHVNKKNINNYGYATDRDFLLEDSQKNKIAVVIGDSYVEALQVKNDDTFHDLLDQSNDSISVYPIGVSGSPLSQYVAFSDFSEKEFNPDIYVFLIISNDFDESWRQVKKAPGFHYFNNDGSLELVDYQPSLLGYLVRKSAFLRYLMIDLKIQAQISRISNVKDIQNIRILKDYELKEELGMKAADLFTRKIKDLSVTKKVIIVTDGDRSSIYNGQSERDFSKVTNRWFQRLINQVENLPRVFFLDLHPVFLEDWQNNQLKFNYEYDFHWNERGHRIVAEALNLKVAKVLKNEKP